MSSFPKHPAPALAGRDVIDAEGWQRLTVSLRLSPREAQIVQFLFDDLKEAAIGMKLGISPHTVHTHIERLYAKLEVVSRSALLVRVFREHLRVNVAAAGASPAAGTPVQATVTQGAASLP